MPETLLRSSDEVEVKSAAEIVATLDGNGCVDALPFMPEMLRHCGRRYRVLARAERICDTISYHGSMRLPDAVILDDLRCDGAGHGGCQAECRLFWKESWLRKVSDRSKSETPAATDADTGAIAQELAASCRNDRIVDGQPVEAYRCQATELVRASRMVGLTDPAPYLRVLRNDGVGVGHFLHVMGRAIVQESLNKLGRVPVIPLAGDSSTAPQDPPLNLQAGEWVQVKSPEEIRRTLGPNGKNRGLWFDREMMVFCGKRFRVRRRVNQIIDETNGRLVRMKNECIVLEGVVCSGERSLTRWFCTRAIYSYWRESWLRRVDGDAAAEKTACAPEPVAGRSNS